MEGVDRLRLLVSGTVGRAVSWWLSELAALVPQRLRPDREKAPAVLDVSAGQTVLVLAGRTAAHPTRIPLAGVDPEDDRRRVQAARHRRGTDEAIIRLDQSAVLECRVTLPLNAERSLRPILENQLERLVPLPADQVEFNYQIVARSTDAKTLSVRLVVATRATIERALTMARSVGLVPRSVITPSAGNESALTLWRPGRDESATATQRWLRRGLEATAVVLCLAAYGSYVYRLDIVRDQLRHDVAVATKASAATRDLINRIAEVDSAVELLKRRQAELDPLVLLTELTKLVPETMWVSQLSLRGRTIEMIGYAPRVADLISRIENHDIFHDPKFRSPITMTPDGKSERFDVSFDVWVGTGP
jgi:general secretion pathway protein L